MGGIGRFVVFANSRRYYHDDQVADIVEKAQQVRENENDDVKAAQIYSIATTLERGDYTPEQANEHLNKILNPSAQSGPCIIATACTGDTEPTIEFLRNIRDESIVDDPIARDFFHVFWSRYYEWSPNVARIAKSDSKVANHIKWSFLEPWLAWLEIVSFFNKEEQDDYSIPEKEKLFDRIKILSDNWISNLPARMEEKKLPEGTSIYDSYKKIQRKLHKYFWERS